MLEVHIHGHSTGLPVVLSLFVTAACFNSIARVVSADDRRAVISCHSTGDRSILSFRFDSLNAMIGRVVSADAGSPHPWPFDWTPSCFIFICDSDLFHFERSNRFGGCWKSESMAIRLDSQLLFIFIGDRDRFQFERSTCFGGCWKSTSMAIGLAS